MSTPFLRTKVPCMAKWVLLLSMAALSSYPQLTEGRSLQQGPLPVQDQCEFQGYENYEEQCGSKTFVLPSCNPGQRRVWQCDPETLPDDFTPVSLDICQSCPPNTFQKWYNKCGTCHPCTVCGEGETEVKACEMEEDTKCVKVSTGTGSMPVIATPSMERPLNPTVTAPPLNPSSEPVLTDEATLETPTPSQTVPVMVPAGKSNDNPHSTPVWIHAVIAFAVLIVLLSVFAMIGWIGWHRERLKRRMPQVVNQEFELNPMNGDVPRHCEEDMQPNERCPLMDEGEPERNQVHRDDDGGPLMDEGEPERNQVHRDDDGGNDVLGDDAHGPPADVEEHDADVPDGAHDTPRSPSGTGDSPLGPSTSGGASNDGAGCSGGTADGELDDEFSPSDGQFVDIPDKISAGATERPFDDTNLSGNPPPEGATGADGDDEADAKDGEHGVSKPRETLVDESNGATGVLPDDQPNGTPNATTTSASGDCLTGDATSSEVHEDNIQKESAPCSNGALGGADRASSSPNTTPEEGATNADIDCNGTTDTDDANHGAEACGVGNDVPVVESPRVPGSGASGHLPNGVDEDAGEPTTAPEEVKRAIQADVVVTTQFLQCVAQEVPHFKIKEICRMLGLREKDIIDIKHLENKDEQGFEFLNRLLGQVGKDLTYRSLLQALNDSKNKHYADELIEKFDIVMRWDDP